MMIFKHASWESFFELDAQKVSILVIENPALLWEYCTDLVKQSNGDAGNFSISKNFAEQVFDKLCNFETTIPGLSLSTKKLQNALIKKCTEMSMNTEFEEHLRIVSLSLYEFCKSVSLETGYSIELDEEIDIAGLFKLFSLSFKENFNSLLEKLIEYVNINAEFLKTKVCIFLFLTKFLTSHEIKVFFEHCRYQGISLILLEEALPNCFEDNSIPYQGLILDNDICEIPIKLKANL